VTDVEPGDLLADSLTDRFALDCPALRPGATRQALEGQSFRFEVQHPFMTTQRTYRLPRAREGQARNGTDAGHRRVDAK
jgi:hypothetical protein